MKFQSNDNRKLPEIVRQTLRKAYNAIKEANEAEEASISKHGPLLTEMGFIEMQLDRLIIDADHSHYHECSKCEDSIFRHELDNLQLNFENDTYSHRNCVAKS